MTIPRHSRVGGRWLALALVLITLASCSLLSGVPGMEARESDGGVTYPDGCREFGLSQRRCDAIVAAIAANHSVDPADATEIRLLGDPDCGDDPHVLCTRTTEFIVRVRLVFADRPPVEDSQFCGVGGEFSLLCTETPQVRLSAPTLDGYHDIPCPGEPPDGCASPVPTIDPDVAGEAEPLVVPSVDISIDRAGVYEIPLGTAVLPNGVLTEASFELADAGQQGFVLGDGVISLVVVGPAGKPIWNVYEQGWRAGTETVAARLVFSVESFEPGTVIRVRNVVVR